jgi:hypothetical protein
MAIQCDPLRDGGAVSILRALTATAATSSPSNTPLAKSAQAALENAYTAATVIKLAEMGKLSLDDKLATDLPDFPNAATSPGMWP